MESQTNRECKMDVESVGHEHKKLKKWKISFTNFFGQAWKMGEDDPRKIIHALKVGLALCIVCPFYLTKPLFDGVGDSAIWAVMTVVVVFEFSADICPLTWNDCNLAGATLSKGLNRALGTLLAGCLALFVGFIAEHAGSTGEAIVIGIATFILGAATTYFRFMPKIKSKYDYGMLIFLLTFNLIAISGYRVDSIATMAYKRLATIALGCGVCLLISLCIFPIWAGEDLHHIIINNLQSLVKSFEGCIQEYFEGSMGSSDEAETDEMSDIDPIYQGYKAILDSKATEESLANFASWEPRHGRFWFRYPWKQYVKTGVMLRHCAYSVVALHGCLRSEIQTPPSVRAIFRQQCTMISREAVKVMEELEGSIRHMRRCRSVEPMMEQIDIAVKDLHAAFGAEPELFVDSKRWHIEEIPEIQEEIKNKQTSAELSDLPGCPSSIPGVEMTHRKFKSGSDFSSHSMDSSQFSRAGSRTSNEAASPQRCWRLVSWHGPESSLTNDILPATPSCRCSSRKKRNNIQFAEAFPLATFASLIVEFTARLKHLVVCVDELGKLARFKVQGLDNWNRENSTASHARHNKFRKDVVVHLGSDQNGAE
eukprot:Gb_00031 [translate_table: standard]